MTVKRPGIAPVAVLVVGLLGWAPAPAPAGELIVDLGQSQGVTFVGALRRWDEGGMPPAPIDPKAKIDAPRVDAMVQPGPGHCWVFRDLPEGRYDLVILALDRRVRVEGFRYAPVEEFDPILPPDAEAPEEARDRIVRDIAESRHYENKVAPLFLAGDDKHVRILVQLVRDQPTSYDGVFGAPVATVRHEIWQYTNRYGGWTKDKKTAVLDRILMAKSEFWRWTWVWEPRLGNIEVGAKPAAITYELPRRFDPETAKGWFPVMNGPGSPVPGWARNTSAPKRDCPARRRASVTGSRASRCSLDCSAAAARRSTSSESPPSRATVSPGSRRPSVRGPVLSTARRSTAASRPTPHPP